MRLVCLQERQQPVTRLRSCSPSEVLDKDPPPPSMLSYLSASSSTVHDPFLPPKTILRDEMALSMGILPIRRNLDGHEKISIRQWRQNFLLNHQ